MKNEKYLEILKKNEKVSFATHEVKAISNSYFLEKYCKHANKLVFKYAILTFVIFKL